MNTAKQNDYHPSIHFVLLPLILTLHALKRLLPNAVTSKHHAKAMKLSPSLKYSLKCPKRLHLEKTQKQSILAPFASSTLGQVVHKRIATSLKTKQNTCTQNISLPKRLVLQENEDAQQLIRRAQDSLTYFNNKCLPYIEQHEVSHIEHRITSTYTLKEETLSLTGVIDCILKTPQKEHIIDWKTSSANYSHEQLRFYLALRQLETQENNQTAEAISLSEQNSHTEHNNPNLKNWLDSYLTELQTDLKNSQTKKAKAGSHCKYCPYAQDCQESQAPERYMLDTWTGEITDLRGASNGSL